MSFFSVIVHYLKPRESGSCQAVGLRSGRFIFSGVEEPLLLLMAAGDSVTAVSTPHINKYIVSYRYISEAQPSEIILSGLNDPPAALESHRGPFFSRVRHTSLTERAYVNTIFKRYVSHMTLSRQRTHTCKETIFITLMIHWKWLHRQIFQSCPLVSHFRLNSCLYGIICLLLCIGWDQWKSFSPILLTWGYCIALNFLLIHWKARWRHRETEINRGGVYCLEPKHFSRFIIRLTGRCTGALISAMTCLSFSLSLSLYIYSIWFCSNGFLVVSAITTIFKGFSLSLSVCLCTCQRSALFTTPA